jgi:hypothetical protein
VRKRKILACDCCGTVSVTAYSTVTSASAATPGPTASSSPLRAALAPAHAEEDSGRPRATSDWAGSHGGQVTSGPHSRGRTEDAGGHGSERVVSGRTSTIECHGDGVPRLLNRARGRRGTDFRWHALTTRGKVDHNTEAVELGGGAR